MINFITGCFVMFFLCAAFFLPIISRRDEKIFKADNEKQYYKSMFEFYSGQYDKYYGKYTAQVCSVKLPLYMPWNMYPDEAPPAPKDGEIRNYPVALYHPEIGLYIDMAEYHGGWPSPWQLVGDGSAVEPFAWYDLPAAPEKPSALYLASMRVAER